MANNDFDNWEDGGDDGNFADFGDDNDVDDIFGDDMDWGSNTSEDDFGGVDESFNAFDDGQENMPDDAMFKHNSRSSGGFGPKTIAIIVVVALLILTGTFLVLDKISFTKKAPTVQQPQQNVEQTQQPTGEASQDTGEDTQTSESTDETNSWEEQEAQQPETIIPDEDDEVVPPSSDGMMELPADTQVDYSGSLYETQGTVHNKIKYLENSQVVYCVQINAKIGESSKLVNYYCGYNVYSSVEEGDTVSVSYQVVSDTCYSVNTISK